MTRVDTCYSIKHKEEHEWHHLESAPDYRSCPNLKTFEEVDRGCCEMGSGETCPYVGEKTMFTARTPGDGKGRWDEDDFERPREWDM